MMLRKILLAGASASMLVMISPGHQGSWRLFPQAEAAVDVSFSIGTFYDRLTTDGDWVRYHGANVFVPDVADDWRPYTVGHWANTRQYGWLWVSSESFGWATYHYGRWAYGDDIGWYWVPGTRWAPAWVSWRRGGDNVIWAPLPPSRNDDDIVSIDISYDTPPDDYWVVVPTRSFLSDDISRVEIRDDRERIRYVDSAQDLGRVRVQNNIVINNILNVNIIERGTSQRVPFYDVRQADRPDRAGRIDNNSVTIFNGNVTIDPKAKPRDVKDTQQFQQFQQSKGRSVGDRANPTMTNHAPPAGNGQAPNQPDQGKPGRNPGNGDNSQPGATDQNKKGQKPPLPNATPADQNQQSGKAAPNGSAPAPDSFKNNNKRNRPNQNGQTPSDQTQPNSGDQGNPNKGNANKGNPGKGKFDQGNPDQGKPGQRPGAQNDNQAPNDQNAPPRRRQKGPDQGAPAAQPQLQQDQPAQNGQNDVKNRKRPGGNGNNGAMDQQAPGGDNQGQQGGDKRRRNQQNDNQPGDMKPGRPDQGGRNRPDAGARDQNGGEQKPDRGNQQKKGGRGCDPEKQDCNQ